jgi:hypothetical protein
MKVADPFAGAEAVREPPQVTVARLHPSVEWVTDDQGYVDCPGQAMHTGKQKKRDCRIIISGAPTIFCLHQSCAAMVEKANYDLRFALWKGSAAGNGGEGFTGTAVSPEEQAAYEARVAKKAEEAQWAKWAKESRDSIFTRFAWNVTDAWEESPLKEDPRKEDDVSLDFGLFLRLFHPSDRIWIGEPTDSGDHARDHFKTAAEWLLAGPLGHFTCPCVFDPSTVHRSNASVLRRPYLVMESDTLSQDQTCAIARWMREFMTLRAIIFTGGKSLHCWFDMPSGELFERLKVTLPILGCDPALFKPSQPVRVPGVKRGDVWQCLYYFNPPTLA